MPDDAFKNFTPIESLPDNSKHFKELDWDVQTVRGTFTLGGSVPMEVESVSEDGMSFVARVVPESDKR